MDASTLTALCPLDGRYAKHALALRNIFSEHALMKARIRIELAWLKTLSLEKKVTEVPIFSAQTLAMLDSLADQFSLKDTQAIKNIENTTQHDIKALEYWLKTYLSNHLETKTVTEFVHFACTSEDINNLSYGLMLKEARDQVMAPSLSKLITLLTNLAHQLAEQPMISRTHGQAASPTTLGKELANVLYRLKRQHQQLIAQPILGKINGAVGNYNAHCIAYSDLDWEKLARRFVETLGLVFNPYTTQIEPHDYIAEYSHVLLRVNTILIDLCRDMWGYISLGYFTQHTSEETIGSSTMPHKINPIHFENAEGNLGLANALLAHFAEKLPVSRFQRDLTDSTVLRNMGVALGYTLLGYQSCQQGLLKLRVNAAQLSSELAQHWALLAEPIQTVMRRYGLNQPYEQLKVLTQKTPCLTQKQLADFIKNLNLPESEKVKLLALTPDRYLGQAIKLAKAVASTSLP